jgi:hypothetical protein
MASRRYRRSRRTSPLEFLIGAAVVGGMIGVALADHSELTMSKEKLAQMHAVEASVYYSGCREAWAAGAAPIHRGEPGYRPEMDGDDDGIACEPYYGN